jgi:hypothetical protein
LWCGFHPMYKLLKIRLMPSSKRNEIVLNLLLCNKWIGWVLMSKFSGLQQKRWTTSQNNNGERHVYIPYWTVWHIIRPIILRVSNVCKKRVKMLGRIICLTALRFFLFSWPYLIKSRHWHIIKNRIVLNL